MRLNHLTPVTTFVLITLSLALNCQIIPERQWPGYRGYMASGVLDNPNLPKSFDFNKMINVRWKTEIPGLGLSSPVIWGDKLFITTAVSNSDRQGIKTGIYGDGMPVADSSVHDWKVFCIDKNLGKIIWERTAYTGIPKIKRHPKSTHANSSVATDGKYAVAFFGSEGLYCYDYEGKLVWEKNFGVLKSVAWDYVAAEWEFASSPIIYNGVVIVQCDVLENSFLAALLLYNDHLYNVNWNGTIACLDAGTGKEIYRAKLGNSRSFIASPVASDGKLYIVDEQGTVYVIQDGISFRQLAEIPMNDICLTAPSITDGMIIFRTQKYLIAVGKK